MPTSYFQIFKRMMAGTEDEFVDSFSRDAQQVALCRIEELRPLIPRRSDTLTVREANTLAQRIMTFVWQLYALDGWNIILQLIKSGTFASSASCSYLNFLTRGI